MKISVAIITLVLLWENACEPPDIKSIIQKYEQNVNASKVLQKDDKRLISNWSEEYQIKRLDVSIKYRMQMLKHEEHSFRTEGNIKWIECLHVHRKDIRKSKSFYHEKELVCLRTCTSRDAEKKQAVELLEKQIVKWRKGYRYLVNLCHLENSGNKENAQQCLVDYMQTDKYDEVIERLIILKQTAMSDLCANYDYSLIDLEECLNTQLSKYLDKVRNLMDVLNKCYSIIT